LRISDCYNIFAFEDSTHALDHRIFSWRHHGLS
jgi:hypothetical protein